MEITKQTKLKRIDLQGVWEDSEDTLKEWFEYVLSTLWQEDKITSEEFDEAKEIEDLNLMILEIKNFADLYEFNFLIIENGEFFEFDEFGRISKYKEYNEDNEKYLKEKYNNKNTLFVKEKLSSNGLDLVAYDISEIKTETKEEFYNYISENGLNEEDFEMDRVTLIEIDL